VQAGKRSGRHSQRDSRVGVSRKEKLKGIAGEIEDRSNPEQDLDGSRRGQGPVQTGARSQRHSSRDSRSGAIRKEKLKGQPKEPRSRRKPNPEARRHRQRSRKPAQAGERIQGTLKSSDRAQAESKLRGTPEGINNRRKPSGDTPKAAGRTQERAQSQSRLPGHRQRDRNPAKAGRRTRGTAEDFEAAL